MIELYGDDYNIEKRLAFLEIDKQEQKAMISGTIQHLKSIMNVPKNYITHN